MNVHHSLPVFHPCLDRFTTTENINWRAQQLIVNFRYYENTASHDVYTPYTHIVALPRGAHLHDTRIFPDEIAPLHSRSSRKAPQKNCYLKARSAVAVAAAAAAAAAASGSTFISQAQNEALGKPWTNRKPPQSKSKLTSQAGQNVNSTENKRGNGKVGALHPGGTSSIRRLHLCPLEGLGLIGGGENTIQHGRKQAVLDLHGHTCTGTARGEGEKQEERSVIYGRWHRTKSKPHLVVGVAGLIIVREGLVMMHVQYVDWGARTRAEPRGGEERRLRH